MKFISTISILVLGIISAESDLKKSKWWYRSADTTTPVTDLPYTDTTKDPFGPEGELYNGSWARKVTRSRRTYSNSQF